jgi:hypothetical protein
MIAALIVVVACCASLLGIEMSIHPPATRRRKWFYRVTFATLFLAGGVLALIQKHLDDEEKKARFPVPAVPRITLETLDGLPAGITNHRAHLRINRLTVANPNDVRIDNFTSRLQLPEPIVELIQTNAPAGTTIDWKPMLLGLFVHGTGGRSDTGIWIGPTSAVYYVYPLQRFQIPQKRWHRTEFSGAGDITGIWELGFDSIPPRSTLQLDFLTSSATNAQNYIQFAAETFWQWSAKMSNQLPVEDPTELRFYFEGEYQFPAEGKPGRQTFLMPVEFRQVQRTLKSLAVQTNNGNWNIIVLEKY